MWTVQRVPWSADGVSPLAPTVKQSMLNYLSEGDDWLPLGIHDKMSLMSKGTGTCEHHGHGLWRIPTPVIDMLQIAGAVVKDVFMYSLSTGHSPRLTGLMIVAEFPHVWVGMLFGLRRAVYFLCCSKAVQSHIFLRVVFILSLKHQRSCPRYLQMHRKEALSWRSGRNLRGRSDQRSVCRMPSWANVER